MDSNEASNGFKQNRYHATHLAVRYLWIRVFLNYTVGTLRLDKLLIILDRYGNEKAPIRTQSMD